jgi:hypothetical protein
VSFSQQQQTLLGIIIECGLLFSFKETLKSKRGPFGKVLVTRSVEQGSSSRKVLKGSQVEELFQFNIQKSGNETAAVPQTSADAVQDQ